MIKVGIVGGTGYTGIELLRLLVAHPEVEITAITSRKEDGVPVSDLFPTLRGQIQMTFTSPDKANLKACDVVFFATPHGVAMAQAPELLEAGVKVIDLAADFRLKDTAIFKQWYKMEHTCPEILAEAVYGLAEINRETIKTARIVSLPGCYPTSVQLGYAPLLKQDQPLVNESALIADAKSGTTGAGRAASASMLFAENSDNFRAYAVTGHRHVPEIKQGLETLTGGREVSITFVPHLLPTIRGIHATLYAPLMPEARNTDFQALFEDFYRDDPFVDVMPAGSHPETRTVRASNYVRIAVHRPADSDMLVVLVVEDNLVKGASGQGVQCMNLMFGLDETIGLQLAPTFP